MSRNVFKLFGYFLFGPELVVKWVFNLNFLPLWNAGIHLPFLLMDYFASK
jgi:hypothetical protein